MPVSSVLYVDVSPVVTTVPIVVVVRSVEDKSMNELFYSADERMT